MATSALNAQGTQRMGRRGAALARGLQRSATPLGFALALASYWLPWVAHRDAGLAIAEVDLVEFPKFMPQYRSGELWVWREAFYVPLLVLGIALVVWAAIGRQPTWRRWLMRASSLLIPVTPSVLNVLESHEFQNQLNMVLVLGVLIAFTPLLRRLPSHGLHVVLIILFAAGAVIPTAQFVLLTPALTEIYREPIGIGWGLWANVIGFALLAFSQLSWKQPTNERQMT